MNYWLAGYPPGDRLEPWIYLSNSSFWGRVTMWCGDLCFFADFGRFSVIFGQKLAVFIFFDKEEEVRFLSGFFPRALARCALAKEVFGGKRTSRGGQYKSPRFLHVFYHTNPPFCTLIQQFHFEKVEKKKGGHAALYIVALFIAHDRRMVQTRHPFGSKC